ncbi:MAG: hypothetical protein Greene071421_499 [Parcubacteria group bacterium Greene0714_21]|nr:MAG: hypothetical protein Greene071421_499 [Parcubacteria group bacterium Greene0714_21]
MNSFILAVSTMVGTIVGAGIFGIPYVVTISGIAPAVFSFLLLLLVVTLLHLFFGEVCLRTSGKHRLVGYAEIYLGKWGRFFASITLFFVLVGTLLAYLILVGHFGEIILQDFPRISGLFVSVAFSIIALVLVFVGRQLIAKIEFFTNIAFVGAIAALVIFALPHLGNVNIPFIGLTGSANLFLPFGVLLFALVGFEAIPEVMSFLRDRKANTKLDNVIVASTLVSGFFLLLFTVIVLLVSGSSSSQDAFSGLVPFLGKGIVWFGATIGIVVIADSFLVIGNYLKNSLRHDFKVPTVPAAILAVGAPLALFLLGIREFIQVISVVGGLIGALEGILIILLFQKAKVKGDRTPEYSIKVPSFVLLFIALLLVGGAAATLLL